MPFKFPLLRELNFRNRVVPLVYRCEVWWFEPKSRPQKPSELFRPEIWSCSNAWRWEAPFWKDFEKLVDVRKLWSQTSQRSTVWSIISGTFDFCRCMTFRWMICTFTQNGRFEWSSVYVGVILMTLVTSRDLKNRHDRFRSIRIDRDLFWICLKRIWGQV